MVLIPKLPSVCVHEVSTNYSSIECVFLVSINSISRNPMTIEAPQPSTFVISISWRFSMCVLVRRVKWGLNGDAHQQKYILVHSNEDNSTGF
jgi:hypothetical protein